MDAIAGKVIDGLSSLALEEFNLLRNLRDDKRRMEDTVSAIKATLLDAEANATSHQVNDWLDKLKDVLYDADDLLDDFSAESLARRVMNRDKSTKKVRTFCSRSNQAAYGHKMSRRMKDIRKKLDGIADDKNKLKLDPCTSKPPVGVKERRQTHSFVHDEEVIGREKEKNLLKSFLLNTNQNNDVSIITIVGFGGLGKTTLAQFLYNDADVQSHFELKMWVCVSDQFDIREIGQKMVDCDKDADKQKVQEKIRNKIKGRRYLLVLDDLWNENRNLWLNLKSLLMEGGKGSMIIVTTRIAKVKEIMDGDLPLDLKGLDDERSWELFSQVAFEEGKEPHIPELVAIGEEIVKKCVGIPLALKTIGSLLYRNLTISVWSYFRDSNLLRIDPENNDISSILKLSYDHLSSNLKNCFVYCSLFPKDYEIERETLIQLWMAQGFISPSDQDRHPEDVGHEYFMNLLSRFFFQDVERDEFGDISTCKMHDLMHDLATLMSENECRAITVGNKENIGDRIRHLSLDVTLKGCWKPPTCLLEAGKLRTFLMHRPQVKRSVISSLISSLKRMRILDLHGLDIPMIPKNIEKLKHLRYLDLSRNRSIEKLPKGITRLHNLQSLKLNHCYELEELPRDINKMVSLRHLELDRCDRLDWMPRGLGQLTSLQTLTQFSLKPTKSDSARLSELGDLNNLKGRLSIFDLQEERGNVAEAESAKLLQKRHLQHLGLYWGTPKDHIVVREEEDHDRDEMLLQALQPHHSIKSLEIRGCPIKMLPGWISNLSSLQRLDISNCGHLASLPESIGNLSSLQKLLILHCSHLASLPESIRNLSSPQQLLILHCGHLASLPESIGNLSSLKQLHISNCDHLASLPESIGNLSSLQQLEISNCDHLASLPESIGNLSSLQQLKISNCLHLASLSESIGNISSLQRLDISNCGHLASLPESTGNLSSLQELLIRSCDHLASLPESIGNLSSLKQLDISSCDHLASLPESIGNLSSLKQLHISDCGDVAPLPESIGNLSSLKRLHISRCGHLASLPESIGNLNLSSLQELEIRHCYHLASLPESIGNLTSLQWLQLSFCNNLASLPDGMRNIKSLQWLRISYCPLLLERCQREEGEDWRKIAHVPNVSIY